LSLLSFRRFTRSAIACASLIWLSACAASITPTSTFDPATAQTGLVMIGQILDTPPNRNVLGMNMCPAFNSRWRVFDSASRWKLVEMEPVPCSDQSDNPRVVYRLRELDPGGYALASGHTKGPLGEQITNFPIGATFASSRTPKFRIGKGEILYVGTIVYSGVSYVSGTPTGIKEVKYDLETAREVLKMYPGIKGELRLSRFEPIPPGPGIPTPPPETPASGQR
jgi:hypothetical protein